MTTALTPFGRSAGTTAAAIRHGDTAYLSGIVGAGDGLAAQARAAYADAVALLHEGGFAPDEVVRVVEYVATAAADGLAEVATARTSALGRAAPAVQSVVVPGFPGTDALVTVEVTASHAGTPTGVDGVAEADGVVYLSTITTPSSDDIVEQSVTVFATLADRLKPLGLDPSNVVMTVDHSTAATLGSYRYTGRARKSTLGPVWPGAAGILQDRLPVDGALLTLDAVATRHPTRGVNPGWERYGKLTYLPAVEAGPLLFMSGQGALDPETEKALYDGDIRAQAAYTYGNVRTVLEAAGLTPQDLISTVEYVTPAGLARYAEVEAVRRDLLGDHAVATTRVLCAGLLRPEFEIEVLPLAARA